MGYPGNTVELPFDDASLAEEVTRACLDPGHLAPTLAAALGLQPSSRLFDRGEMRPPIEQTKPGHLTATAWVLDGAARRVLLVRHDVLGWAQPGGHVEMGEHPRAAAARELAEETGLTLEPADPLPLILHASDFPAHGGHPAHRHWNIGYLFLADPAEPLVAEPGRPVRWFAVDDLPDELAPDLAPLLPLVLEAARASRPGQR